VIKRFVSSIQQYTDGLYQALEQSLRPKAEPDSAAVDLGRTRLELMLENALLRLQVNILKRYAEHPKRTQCNGDD